LKFGKSWEDVQNEPVNTGDFMRYFKQDDTVLRLIEEPSSWVGFWEHFNPNGFSFPCNSEDRANCPGCQSDNQKMKKASRKIAINVIDGDRVAVYKFPKTLADKLANRHSHIGTVTDRDYRIFKLKSRNSDGSTKVDYDVEGMEKVSVDLSKYEPMDVEKMLVESYEQSWGSNGKANIANGNVTSDDPWVQSAQAKGSDEPPPFREPEAKQTTQAEGAATRTPKINCERSR